MTKIIDELRTHKFFKVKETNSNCPICGYALYSVNRGGFIMDANKLYYCENAKEHRFWKHPFENRDVLHLNKNASETNWDSEQDYEFINGFWVEVDKE